MKTEVIRYNLRERGRTYRGKPRNFDIPRMVAAINSGACQEKVKHRDMLGYYGHWPRVKFGMNPSEGGVVDGNVVRVEPAIVTTYLKALDDGTIEHQAEFLDNEAGRLAYALYKTKAGGFSSAIDEFKSPGPEFYGFDYVLEPNYTTNRGYTLDSVLEEALTLDDVHAAERYMAHVTGMGVLLDAIQTDRDAKESERNATELMYRMSLQTVAKLQAHNEELTSLLTRRNPTLDALEVVGDAPLMVSRSKGDALRKIIGGFRGARLEPIVEPSNEPARDPAMDSVTNRIMSR